MADAEREEEEEEAHENKQGEDQGGYRFDQPEHKAALLLQRQQLWAWIKREGTNLLDLTRISLPVGFDVDLVLFSYSV